MTGKISDIDAVYGSDSDQEGGIVVVLKDKSEIVASYIEFNMNDLTFETS